MEKCIIQYVLKSLGDTIFLYKEDVILFFEDFYYDNFSHNSLNLSKLYNSFLKNGDKTTFDEFYFSIDDINDLVLINNNYENVMLQILNSINKREV